MIETKYVDALEACSRCHCGCCKDGCPIYSVMLEEQLSARGRNLILRAYLNGVIDANPRLARIVYSCLLCRLDEENCRARIPNAEIYERIRADLVSRGFGPLPEHEPLLASLKNYGNPWMQPSSARDRWVKRAKPGKSENGELYFAGCTFALDSRIQNAPIAFVKLLRSAGREIVVLGREESCCGSVALRIGDREGFQRLRDENKEKLASYKRVITSCAGCFKTMSQDYESEEESPEIVHSVQVILEHLRGGRLVPGRLGVRVTYHDPCHLGRHSGVYDTPREIINSIPGVELVEMKNSRERARCCGAGAGVKTAIPKISSEIARRRIEEACDTGASILVSACPFCEQNLREAAEALGKKLEVLDVSELLLRACSSRPTDDV